MRIVYLNICVTLMYSLNCFWRRTQFLFVFDKIYILFSILLLFLLLKRCYLYRSIMKSHIHLVFECFSKLWIRYIREICQIKSDEWTQSYALIVAAYTLITLSPLEWRTTTCFLEVNCVHVRWSIYTFCFKSRSEHSK